MQRNVWLISRTIFLKRPCIGIYWIPYDLLHTDWWAWLNRAPFQNYSQAPSSSQAHDPSRDYVGRFEVVPNDGEQVLKIERFFQLLFFYFAWPHYTNAFILLIFVDALEFNADALLAWLNSKAPQRTSSQRATPLMKGIEFSKGRKRGKEGLSTYSKKKNKASMDKHVLRFMLLNIFEPSSVSSGRHISPSLNSAPLYLLTL